MLRQERHFLNHFNFSATKYISEYDRKTVKGMLT